MIISRLSKETNKLLNETFVGPAYDVYHLLWSTTKPLAVRAMHIQIHIDGKKKKIFFNEQCQKLFLDKNK